MKSNFFKAVLFGLAVLCGPAAAQNSESINADSTKVEQQVSNQKGQTTRPATERVKKVIKVKNGAVREDSVVFKGGATEVYQDRALGSLSLAELRAINAGETKAVKRFNRNYDGQLRRGGYVGLPVAVFFGENVDPMVGVEIGYHTRNWDFSLPLYWTPGHLPTNSDQPGANFNAFYCYLNMTWKALHTSNGYWSFGPGGSIGYGVQKTNNLNTGGSTNAGVTGRLFLAASWQATNHFVISLRAGAMNKVVVDHAINGTEWQQFNKNTIKPFAELSAEWYF